jgi:hypothetical protein
MMTAAIKKPPRRLAVRGKSYCVRSKRGVRPMGPRGEALVLTAARTRHARKPAHDRLGAGDLLG